MKEKIMLKSLADLPANVFDFAASAPGRAMNASKQILGASVRAAEFARRFYVRANAPFNITPWQRGGLNE